MVGTKNNRRTQYTKQRLQEAMITLLAGQPLAKITVTALCKAADVNRGTFYAHYQDPTALFRAIEADLIAEIQPLLGGTERGLDQWLPAVLAVIAREETATQIIIQNLDDSPLLQAILDPIRTRTLDEYRRRFHEDDPAVLGYYFEFCLSGAVRVIVSWLRGGARESPEQIARVIANLSPL